MATKVRDGGAKSARPHPAYGDELALLVQCPLYSLHINFRSSNLSPGFEIGKTVQVEQVVLTPKKIGARIETFGKSFAATGLDEKQRPRIFRRIA
jgi:hypothetical protein